MNELHADLELAQEVHSETGHGMLALLGAARRIQERLETALESAGLSPAKYQALDQLTRAGRPMPLSELADCLHCVRSNVTQLVDRLEADGLVQRTADPNDRRATRATLTSRGLDRHRAGLEAIGRLERDLASQLTPAERSTLLRALVALSR